MSEPAQLAFVWLGIAVCLAHSAMFSGLNLALMGLSRLRLEAEARTGNPAAQRVLALRRDANLLLTTLLWGNVAVNVLLTMLSESVLAGVSAFVFSTFGITLVGEIVPQAWFSRNALRAGAALTPVVRFYELLLYPIAKPSALLLDAWIGPESIRYFRERDLREVLALHAAAAETDLDRAEAQGALNFLELDDVPIVREGEPLDPRSLVRVERADRLPPFEPRSEDPFLRRVHASRRKWVVLVDASDEPGLVIDADGFLRDALLDPERLRPEEHCHRPVVVRDPQTPLGEVLLWLRVEARHEEDDVVDRDVVLLWTREHRRILTGADLLGRLLRGIATRTLPPRAAPGPPC